MSLNALPRVATPARPLVPSARLTLGRLMEVKLALPGGVLLLFLLVAAVVATTRQSWGIASVVALGAARQLVVLHRAAGGSHG